MFKANIILVNSSFRFKENLNDAHLTSHGLFFQITNMAFTFLGQLPI